MTRGKRGADTNPVWSPDGSAIAFVSTAVLGVAQDRVRAIDGGHALGRAAAHVRVVQPRQASERRANLAQARARADLEDGVQVVAHQASISSGASQTRT